MNECSPLPQELTDGYRKTTHSLFRTGKIISLLDCKLSSLSQRSPDYSENVSRIKKSRECIEAKALPLLTTRKEELEAAIDNKINEFASHTGKTTFSIVDIAKLSNFKLYKGSIDGPKRRRIKEAALGLGTIVGVKEIRFLPEEAKKIIIKLAGYKNDAFSVLGKEIALGRNAVETKRLLQILETTSKENPMSISQLAEAMYGDKIPLKTGKKRVIGFFRFLRPKLEKKDLFIEKKLINLKKIKKGNRRSADKLLYYLVDKGKFPLKHNSKKPVSNKNITYPGVSIKTTKKVSEDAVGRKPSVEEVIFRDRDECEEASSALPQETQVIAGRERQEERAMFSPVNAKIKNWTLLYEITDQTDSFSDELFYEYPKLETKQIAALAIMLRAPKYKPFLKQCGIRLKEEQCCRVNNVFNMCRNEMGEEQLHTDKLLKESIPLLTQFLKGFTNGGRRILFRESSSRGRILLEMIPARIGEDEIESLMINIEKSMEDQSSSVGNQTLFKIEPIPLNLGQKEGQV